MLKAERWGICVPTSSLCRRRVVDVLHSGAGDVNGGVAQGVRAGVVARARRPSNFGDDPRRLPLESARRIRYVGLAASFSSSPCRRLVVFVSVVVVVVVVFSLVSLSSSRRRHCRRRRYFVVVVYRVVGQSTLPLRRSEALALRRRGVAERRGLLRAAGARVGPRRRWGGEGAFACARRGYAGVVQNRSAAASLSREFWWRRRIGRPPVGLESIDVKAWGRASFARVARSCRVGSPSAGTGRILPFSLTFLGFKIRGRRGHCKWDQSVVQS